MPPGSVGSAFESGLRVSGRVIKKKKKKKIRSSLWAKIEKRKRKKDASAANRTRGPSMATMDFTTKPLMLVDCESNSIKFVTDAPLAYLTYQTSQIDLTTAHSAPRSTHQQLEIPTRPPGRTTTYSQPIHPFQIPRYIHTYIHIHSNNINLISLALSIHR
ncbi:uncharacterized protein K452DRAFT_72629 [Aplosporella prunicola CBS 121167]|uniref:Uncharacterized protein n=1 Tax=Aplosporella prunicola CBS 121167 TaxID=1176127 RepID=A0A6A6BS36_9PEZI|nr:uncharacterized protein K452DRAFT_72629 [Aplosporella prunicola CBS 121167]KAF2146912.1 hypothetical protein K452DRAFT_72629 [Aplosporella prunicola CBS 121167]